MYCYFIQHQTSKFDPMPTPPTTQAIKKDSQSIMLCPRFFKIENGFLRLFVWELHLKSTIRIYFIYTRYNVFRYSARQLENDKQKQKDIENHFFFVGIWLWLDDLERWFILELDIFALLNYYNTYSLYPMPVVAVHLMGAMEWKEKGLLHSKSPANSLSPYSPCIQ